MGWPVTALKCFLILVSVAFTAWFVLSSSPGTNKKAFTSFGKVREFVAGQMPGRHSVPEEPLASVAAVDANEVPVMREGEHCIIRQALRNTGRETIHNIAVGFQFRDEKGNDIGGQGKAQAAARIKASESRIVNFKLPCSRDVADARITLPGNIREATDQSRIVLLRDHENWDEVGENGSYIVVAAVPDLAICPLPDPCRLAALVNGGKETDFAFSRNSSDPAQLTSDDSILVAHLQRGKNATVRARSPSGEMSINLSDRNLVRVTPDSITEWLERLFQGTKNHV